jgi:hypothetical protein
MSHCANGGRYAARVAGRMAPCGRMLEVAEAARAARPTSQPPRACDLLLDGVAMLTTDGYAAGAPILTRALSAFRTREVSTEEGFRWLPLACRMSPDVWDDQSWYALSTRLIELAREAGALTVLPAALVDSRADRSDHPDRGARTRGRCPAAALGIYRRRRHRLGARDRGALAGAAE